MLVIFSIPNVTLGVVVIIFNGRWENNKAGSQTGGEHIREFNQPAWPWHLTFFPPVPQLRAATPKPSRRGQRNWKGDSHYLLSDKSCSGRPGKHTPLSLSVPRYNSARPIRPGWLLSGDVILIIIFLASMREGIRSRGKAKMKRLPDVDKGKQEEGA